MGLSHGLLEWGQGVLLYIAPSTPAHEWHLSRAIWSIVPLYLFLNASDIASTVLCTSTVSQVPSHKSFNNCTTTTCERLCMLHLPPLMVLTASQLAVIQLQDPSLETSSSHHSWHRLMFRSLGNGLWYRFACGWFARRCSEQHLGGSERSRIRQKEKLNCKVVT